MSSHMQTIIEMLQQDQRYKLEGYQFVRDALQYSQEVLGLGEGESPVAEIEDEDEEGIPPENHLTGQQLCEGIRRYALQQFGYLAPLVLESWGIRSTSDFGEMVYNLIRIEQMKKSKHDRREDFDDVYDFASGFEPSFSALVDD